MIFMNYLPLFLFICIYICIPIVVSCEKLQILYDQADGVFWPIHYFIDLVYLYIDFFSRLIRLSFDWSFYIG
jgi:hypothetical protein